MERDPLPIARQRLSDAVAALAAPVPHTEHGATCWTPPLYSRLRTALRGQPHSHRRMVPGSRLPCRADVLGLVVEIDTLTGKWERGADALDRLHRLAERDRAPGDSGLLDTYSQRIERWALAAADLLSDSPPTVPLRYPCPRCGRRYVYRRDGAGDTVRSDALRVSELGADCGACKATWAPEQFAFLAQLLGIPALATE